MRLNPFDTDNIDVRGSSSRFPGGGAGQLGCGTLILAGVVSLLFGTDLGQTIAVFETVDQATNIGQTANPNGTMSEQEVCTQNEYATEACNALQSLNETWQPEFERAGIEFQQPFLHIFSGGVNTQGCGSASSAVGPFYCPADGGIYIDTSFYDLMQRELGANGDFARLYVVAHEYGHHIQNLTGLAGQVRSAQQQDQRRANELNVRMELQADCYAGVWAGKNKNRIEPGDFEEGMRAAAAIGDDAISERMGGRVSPESFTHGTSAQRMEALRLGMNSGNDTVCDRYFAPDSF
ncbi:neutral zinc metallopeptidase [Alteriqipengyuania sp.]|uniref:KPN_02809 family neutral zinc metallopeptidase n=1 Tax=Alteriqipengyuania sp. TaxID=2800692 RepID=UPI003513B5DF